MLNAANLDILSWPDLKGVKTGGSLVGDIHKKAPPQLGKCIITQDRRLKSQGKNQNEAEVG